MGWSSTSQARSATGRVNWREQAFGPHGTYSATWAAYLGGDPLMKGVVMAVELVLGGGQRWYLCTDPAVLTRSIASAADALPRGYTGQLMEEPEIECSYTPGDGAASQRSVSFRVGVPGFNPWQVIRQQQRILAGFGQISLIAPGIPWRDRFVLLTGDMVGGVTFGGQGEVLGFKLQDPAVSADLGITEYVTDSDRFPSIPEEYVGQRFPLALNSPQTASCVRTTTTAPPTFLVCYGHEYDVTTAYVDGEGYASASGVYPWTVQYLVDDLGAPYTAIVFTAGTGLWEDTTSVHADVIPRASRRQAKDVIATIRELVENWSLLGPALISADAFNRAQGRVPAASSPGVFINGSGDDDATTALAYVEDTICGEMPMISMAWQPGGYGPIVTNRKAHPVATWVVGQGPLYDRASEWEESAKEDTFNWLTYKYNYLATTDVYQSVIQRNPNNSTLCQISEEQSGSIECDPIESVLVTDSALATWVVDWMIEHQTVPWYKVDYDAEPAVLMKYRLGDNVDLVDPEIWGCTIADPVRATIIGIRYARGKCTVTLALWVLYLQFSGGAGLGGTAIANPGGAVNGPQPGQ